MNSISNIRGLFKARLLNEMFTEDRNGGKTIELIGLILIFGASLLAISFFSYSPSDPTFIHGSQNVAINNLLGIYGGLIADFLLQSFGLVSFLFLTTVTIWGISLIIKKEIKKFQFKIFYLFLYHIFACIFIYIIFNNSFWLIDNGNSGFVGQVFYDWILNLLPLFVVENLK